MKKTKKRLCQSCKQRELYYRGGIPISKYCSICKKLKEQEKKEKKKLTKKYIESERKRLHKKAWKLMSEWVRRSAARGGQTLCCYTCGKWIPWREAHCSHFHHGKLDFDSRNLRPCCSACNTYRGGNLAIYATKLVIELGPEGMEQLYLDSNIVKYSKDDLDRIILNLEEKLKLLNPSL